MFCTLVWLVSFKWILWVGCNDGKSRNLSLEIHQCGGYLPFILLDLGPPFSEPWEINFCWHADGFQLDSVNAGLRREPGRKEQSEAGLFLAQLPPCRFTVGLASNEAQSSCQAASSCNNLYFQIPVPSSTPYLFRHGVARSVFHPRELPWSSWRFLLTDLPIPLLNSPKGLPRWH